MSKPASKKHPAVKLKPRPQPRKAATPGWRRPSEWPKGAVIAAWAAGAVVIAAALTLGVVFPVTDSPSFCPTCHEMTPFHDAWTKGAHDRVSCLDCHVDQGYPNRVVHKFVALAEVWGHFTGQGKFPLATPPVIPDARCLYCHDGSQAAAPTNPYPEIRFGHAEHGKGVTCQQCHVDSGHAVTDAALAAAGALNPATAAVQRTVVQGKSAALLRPAGGAIVGHKAVVCSACHPMPKMGCKACHTSPHQNPAVSGDCSTCHKPGATFAGANHPARTDCATCHHPPAGHPAAACLDCHKPGKPFTQPDFTHPAVDAPAFHGQFQCTQCHPKGFATADCQTCHAARGGD